MRAPFELPYLDEHEVAAAASPEEVWAALPGALRDAFDRSRAHWLARILGCEGQGGRGELDGAPAETLAGFHVTSAQPPHEIALEGRHRFSRYRLAFEIDPSESGSKIRAVTHAEFPGVRGALYRAMVVGSGGHRIVTTRILRSIARRAERAHSHRTAEEEH
jgi:hypothetical protein